MFDVVRIDVHWSSVGGIDEGNDVMFRLRLEFDLPDLRAGVAEIDLKRTILRNPYHEPAGAEFLQLGELPSNFLRSVIVSRAGLK